MKDKRSAAPKKAKKKKPQKKEPTRAKPKKESDEKPKSDRAYRLKLITDLIVANKVRGNPRDYVVISQAKQILDVSGVYEIRATLPDPLESGNHVWVRGKSSSGRTVVVSAIVIEDHIVRETTEGDQDCVMVRDEPRTKEWLIPRSDLSPLPLVLEPMIIHKKNLDQYIGKGWSEVFWNHRLRRRRAEPKKRIIRRLN